jgi:hypothetical protein
MAGETVSGGQSDSMFFSNWVGSSILDEIRPHNVIKPLLRYEGRRPSLVFNFPLQDDPGAAASNQTEGTAFTNTALATSSQTATARLNGMVATVTDVLDAISIVDAVSHFSQVLGRSCAEEMEVTLGALFANSTGAWSAASLAGFYNAMADLEAADATGSFCAVVLPAALNTMRTDITTATTVSYAANPHNVAHGHADAKPSGQVGNNAGVDVYLTSASGTNVMFVKGVAHGIYEVWDLKTETHRDTFQPGTQIAATTLYGGATIRAAWSTDVA